MRSSKRPKKRNAERAVYTPRARRELAAAVRWIAQDNPPAASAFRRALDDAADRIVRYPQLGRSRPDIASEPVRFLVLTGFPYVVIYDPTHAPPRIVSIQHGARDLVTALGDL